MKIHSCDEDCWTPVCVEAAPWIYNIPKWQLSYLKQELTQGNKGGSVIWFLSPTLQHHVIDIVRTVFRLREAFTFFINLVQDLGWVFWKGKNNVKELKNSPVWINVMSVLGLPVFLKMCFNICFDYLAPIEAQPRLLAMSKHLPQSDSKHPRVSGMRERSGLQTLWGAPEAGRTTTLMWNVQR